MKKVVLVLVMSIFSIGLVGCSGDSETTSGESSSSYDFETEFDEAKEEVDDEELLVDPETEDVAGQEEASSLPETQLESSSSAPTYAQDDSVTRQQKNALGAAESYLDYSSFSKLGLYDQLIFEEYPADAAQYAIDNVEADWKENALQTAQDYLDFSSFSDQGLYDQLIHDKYTIEEAQYAIDNLPN